ncbi:MAG: ribosome small subunit-dependent GTPase A [Phycisphaerae bacterium]|nr:ribosome small subunit-dependent GTPase A [Phycisphaerae bacterium]
MADANEKKGKKPGRKVRVSFRSNRSRPSRTKDWTRQHRAGEDIEVSASESVVAKGHLSRKRTIIETDEPQEGLIAGTVVTLRGQFAAVDDGKRIWPCTVRRILRTLTIGERFPVTVGDRVRFRVVADAPGVQAEGVIVTVEPRQNELRRFAGRRVQVIAANVDQVLIVSSADLPPPKPHLIDRYIVSALAGGMTPVIGLNKIDLDTDGRARTIAQRYAMLGYCVLCCSALTNEGVDELRQLFRGRSTVLAGQSGVGKSSLLNAIQPGLKLRVGTVSDETLKGRHTTTTAELIRLAGDAYVVDTPGVRSFDVSMIPRGELEQYFTEFVPLVPECKFPDCTHIPETGCAIKRAVKEERIHPERYESYVRMFEDRTEGGLA